MSTDKGLDTSRGHLPFAHQDVDRSHDSFQMHHPQLVVADFGLCATVYAVVAGRARPCTL